MTGSTDRPIAISTWVWHSPLTADLLEPRLRTLATWGFEAVEMPYEEPGDWDPIQARDLLQQHGLHSTVGCVFRPGRELAGASSETISETKEYVRQCIDLATAQGSGLVGGPIYTSVGRTGRISHEERSRLIAELKRNLSELGQYAGERGVRLAIEPLNRYETNLINTAAQLIEILDDLPASVGATLDTYHMNIEESSWSAAIEQVGSRLMHMQVCANDRGTPGRDHLAWTAIGAALNRVDYRGQLCIESFTAENETIATAASIWRPLAPSQDDLAVDGLRFLAGWREGSLRR